MVITRQQFTVSTYFNALWYAYLSDKFVNVAERVQRAYEIYQWLEYKHVTARLGSNIKARKMLDSRLEFAIEDEDGPGISLLITEKMLPLDITNCALLVLALDLLIEDLFKKRDKNSRMKYEDFKDKCLADHKLIKNLISQIANATKKHLILSPGG